MRRVPNSTLRRFAPNGLAAVTLAVFACGESVPTDPDAQQQTPTVATVQIAALQDSLRALGATTQLSATARDASGAEIASASFTWSSSAPNVATVDSSGLVKAIDVGTAAISATAGGVSDTLSIWVVQFVSAVEIRHSRDTLTALGDTTRLTAVARDSLGAAVPNVAVTWSSVDPLTAQVDSAGLVTAVANGTTAIRASMDTATGTLQMVVRQLVASIAVDTSGVALSGIGSSWDFDATARDWLGHDIAGTQFSWSSLNDDVATVDATGTVRTHRDGQVTVQAMADGVAGHALVTVSLPQPGTPRTWSRGVFQRFNAEAVWGSDPTHVWAVGHDAPTSLGEKGRIARYDGSDWLDVTPDLGEWSSLYAVWGTSSTDVWAAGENATGFIRGALLHFDGSVWSDVTPTEMTSGNLQTSLYGVWCSGPNDVWAVGLNNIAHYDGQAWDPNAASGGAEAVWGTGTGDVWAVGWRGKTVHCDNAGCTELDPKVVDKTLRGVWGTGPNDVWAAGDDGTIVHYDGSDWTDLTAGLVDDDLFAIWGTGPDDVWLVGDAGSKLHWSGTTWTVTRLGTGTYRQKGIWGSAATSVWAVGWQGVFDYYDGTTWTDRRPGVTFSDIYAAWGSSSSDVWAVGPDATIVHYDGTAWSSHSDEIIASLPQYQDEPFLRGIWGASPDDVWAVSNGGGIYHYDGSTWELSHSYQRQLSTIWGSGPADIWAITSGAYAYRYDGSEWSSDVFPLSVSNIEALWGASADDVWGVGGRGSIVHYNGVSWSGLAPGITNNDMRDVWGSGPDDVWAVGHQGTILHYNGTDWSDESYSQQYSWDGVWGTGPSDVWVVGSGKVLHFDGTEWTEVEHGLTEMNLLSLWGTSQSELWVFGSYGTTLAGSP